MIDLSELIALLNNNILKQYNTILMGGFSEPFYQASKDGCPAQIQFSHDYIRSALHELAHWCVAGNERRKLDDFGYWYAADGRNQKQQDEFFKLEIKPQAIEWAFSIICGVNFEVSIDNLNSHVIGIESFKFDVINQLNEYLSMGFSVRVQEIIRLCAIHRDIMNPNAYIAQKLSNL